MKRARTHRRWRRGGQSRWPSSASALPREGGRCMHPALRGKVGCGGCVLIRIRIYARLSMSKAILDERSEFFSFLNYWIIRIPAPPMSASLKLILKPCLAATAWINIVLARLYEDFLHSSSMPRNLAGYDGRINNLGSDSVTGQKSDIVRILARNSHAGVGAIGISA